MQSGAWTAVGFPVENADARHAFYTYANWVYQIGVFVSRSSGLLYQVRALCISFQNWTGGLAIILLGCKCFWYLSVPGLPPGASCSNCIEVKCSDPLAAASQASRSALFAMPVLQVGLLVFFLLVAVLHFLYSWWLLIPCLCTGEPHGLLTFIAHVFVA